MNFLKTMAASAVLAVAGASAHAAVIDFAGFADANGEGSYEGANIMGVTLDSQSISGDYAYLDKNGGAGPAGLGVCQQNVNECRSDDNIGLGAGGMGDHEGVKVTFDIATNVFGLSFTNANHKAVNANDTLLINGLEYTFGAASTAFFDDVASLTFEYGGKSANQFYVNSISTVPLPAAGWLLIAGLGGIAAVRRKKS